MANNVKMEDGVAVQFKGQMQGAFDFLVDCSNSIENCRIVEDLGFDNGSIAKFKSSIKTTEDSINGLLENVTGCENEIIQLDSSGTERVSEIFPIDEEIQGDVPENTKTSVIDYVDTTDVESKSSENSSYKSGSDRSFKFSSTSSSSSSSVGVTSSLSTSSSTNTSVDVASSSSTSSSTNTSVDVASSSSTSSSTNTSVDVASSSSTSSSTNTSVDVANSTDTSTTSQSTSQENSGASENYSSYNFNYSVEEALSNGDVFADDNYNLTSFTNYLLYRYGIKDKNVAKKIYQSVINYGNNYYKLNGSNPLKVVPQNEILSSIYKDIKDLVPNSNEETFWSMLKDIKL